MVRSVTNLSRSGVSDWVIQRVGAVVLLAWFLFIGYTILTLGDAGYLEWRALFSRLWMKVFTLAAVLALFGHGWVGMWTVFTDYLTRGSLGASAAWVRFVVQVICFVVLLLYVVWAVQILWSI